MPTLDVRNRGGGAPNTQNLSTAQTGNAASTNTIDRMGDIGPGLLVITSTIGATPTVTVDIQGSVDGTNWFNIPYALIATPSTFVVTSITITTAVTGRYVLQGGIPWRFMRLNYTANTNVTLTADVTTFPTT